MKRSIIFLSLIAFILFPAISFGAAGTCSATDTKGSPAGVAKVTFTCTGGTATELMPTAIDRTFTGGGTAWANVDINAFDETTDLTITATASGQYCTLPVASAPTTAGVRYRVTYDLANLVSTWVLQSFDGTQTIGTISATATQGYLEWVATTTGGFRIVAGGNTSSGDFDNFTLSNTGTVPETAVPTWFTNYLAKEKPYYLYRVEARPTSGGTAPDAASVFLFDANGMDLLGSEDGTTAYSGLNLIHATLPRATVPNLYLPRAGSHLNYFPEIAGTLSMKVIDQSTASADFTIDLIFVEGDN